MAARWSATESQGTAAEMRNGMAVRSTSLSFLETMGLSYRHRTASDRPMVSVLVLFL
jgi:hypothetical protein